MYLVRQEGHSRARTWQLASFPCCWQGKSLATSPSLCSVPHSAPFPALTPSCAWVVAPTLKLLFSSFNNVLQLISCFFADNLSKSSLWQVLIWVMTAWSTFLVGNYWVRSEQVWYPLTVSKAGTFTTHSLKIHWWWIALKFALLLHMRKICLLSSRSYHLCLFCQIYRVQDMLALWKTTFFKARYLGVMKLPLDQNSNCFWGWIASCVPWQICSTDMLFYSDNWISEIWRSDLHKCW